jgi:hypothetical protein
MFFSDQQQSPKTALLENEDLEGERPGCSEAEMGLPRGLSKQMVNHGLTAETAPLEEKPKHKLE